MSLPARLSGTKRFWRALFLYHYTVFPSGIGLVVFRTLTPFVRRVVIILVMLGALRAYLQDLNVNGHPTGNFLENATPILWGVLGFLTLPPLFDLAEFYFTKRNAKKRRSFPYEKIAERLGCDVAQLEAWFAGQDRFLPYFVAMPLIYGLLAFALTPAFIAYVASEIFFWVALAAWSWAPMTNRVSHTGLRVDGVTYIAFAVYVILLAYILFIWPAEFHIEVLFLVIMVPRIQYANMRRAARYLLNIRDVGADDDRSA